MLRVGPYLFKQAESTQEFEQIHCLNYRTFVSEIPQHADTGSGQLVDKFHHKNVYFICLKEGRLVGMLSTHDQPPFSVAERLPDPTVLTQPGMKPLEVRLLAIEPDERHSNLFFGLVWILYEYAHEHHYSHLIISGVAQRVRLYERLGFAVQGPAVICGQASFVPMFLTVGQLPKKILRVKAQWESHVRHTLAGNRDEPARPTNTETAPLKAGARALAEADICLLPGPVTIAAAVRHAFQQPPIYHRGPEFVRRFDALRQLLGRLVGGRSVAILNGSGTLANESVAATLAALPCEGRGIMLINGEFGQRLARQAERFGLLPRHLSWDWGQPWDLEEIDAALSQEPPGSWIWGVHQESSTGVLNDLPGLVRVASRHGIRVCVDCISSLGAVPIDLSEIFLATASSGKALGSYAGAALVFADLSSLEPLDRRRIPSYLDLVAAITSQGPCYTFPSPTLLALEAALQEYATPKQAQDSYARYADLGRYVRQQLRQLQLQPLAQESYASPVVTTFAPPAEETSLAFVQRCLSWGIAIGGQSAYLSQRRLVQIATMGAVTHAMCRPLFERLAESLTHHSALVLTR